MCCLLSSSAFNYAAIQLNHCMHDSTNCYVACVPFLLFVNNRYRQFFYTNALYIRVSDLPREVSGMVPCIFFSFVLVVDFVQIACLCMFFFYAGVMKAAIAMTRLQMRTCYVWMYCLS